MLFENNIFFKNVTKQKTMTTCWSLLKIKHLMEAFESQKKLFYGFTSWFVKLV